MGLDRRVTLSLPHLVPSYPHPLGRHFGLPHFDLSCTKSAQKLFQKRGRIQTRFRMHLDPDFK